MKKTLISGSIFLIIAIAIFAVLTILDLISFDMAEASLKKIGGVLLVIVLASLGIKGLLLLNKK